MISLIMCVYNTKEEYLVKSLESVIKQTFNDIEFILINDGSTVISTNRILKNFVKRWHDERPNNEIKYIEQENQGLSESLNIALTYAKGDYVSFVDSDDILSIYTLEILYNVLVKYDVDISIGATTSAEKAIKVTNNVIPPAKIFNSIDSLLNLCHFPGSFNENIFLPLPNFTQFRSLWNKLYKTEIFKDIIFPKGKLRNSQFVNHRIYYKINKVALNTKNTYFYRPHGELSKTLFIDNYLLESFEDKLRFFEEKFHVEPMVIKENLDDLIFREAKKQIIYNNTLQWYEHVKAKMR